MKLQILLFLMGLWNTYGSKSKKSCHCGKLSKPKNKTVQNTRIYNGRDAHPVHEPFPWQIFLTMNFKTCGGSLISRKHILTAAHCFFDLKTYKELSYKEGYAYAVVIDMGTKVLSNGDRVQIPEKFEQGRTFTKENVEYYPTFDIKSRPMKGNWS